MFKEWWEENRDKIIGDSEDIAEAAWDAGWAAALEAVRKNLEKAATAEVQWRLSVRKPSQTVVITDQDN